MKHIILLATANIIGFSVAYFKDGNSFQNEFEMREFTKIQNKVETEEKADNAPTYKMGLPTFEERKLEIMKEHEEIIKAISEGNAPYAERNDIVLYNRNNPLDLNAKQKEELRRIRNLYPKTKKLVRKEENPNLINAKASCIHSDKTKLAIGYGDNSFYYDFLEANPKYPKETVDTFDKTNPSFCITNDYSEFNMHKHLEKEVINKVNSSEMFKKWGHLFGDNYRASLYSKVYNVGYPAFSKSKVYQLMLDHPLKNAKAIDEEWLKWENEKRREREVQEKNKDPVFIKHLALYQKPKQKTLKDALKEIGA